MSETFVRFKCRGCGSTLVADPRKQGKKARCPTCCTLMTAPLAQPALSEAIMLPPLADSGALEADLHSVVKPAPVCPQKSGDSVAEPVAVRSVAVGLPTTPTWFFQENGEERGPFFISEMEEKAKSGKIGPKTLVRQAAKAWMCAFQVPFLADFFQAEPDQEQTTATATIDPPVHSKTAGTPVPSTVGARSVSDGAITSRPPTSLTVEQEKALGFLKGMVEQEKALRFVKGEESIVPVNAEQERVLAALVAAGLAKREVNLYFCQGGKPEQFTLPNTQSERDAPAQSTPEVGDILSMLLARQSQNNPRPEARGMADRPTPPPEAGWVPGRLFTGATMRHPGLKVLAACCLLVALTTLFPPTNDGFGFLFTIHDEVYRNHVVEGHIHWGRLVAEWIVGIAGVCAFALLGPSLKQPLSKTWQTVKESGSKIWGRVTPVSSDNLYRFAGLAFMVGMAVMIILGFLGLYDRPHPSTTESKKTDFRLSPRYDPSWLIPPSSKESSPKQRGNPP